MSDERLRQLLEELWSAGYTQGLKDAASFLSEKTTDDTQPKMTKDVNKTLRKMKAAKAK